MKNEWKSPLGESGVKVSATAPFLSMISTCTSAGGSALHRSFSCSVGNTVPMNCPILKNALVTWQALHARPGFMLVSPVSPPVQNEPLVQPVGAGPASGGVPASVMPQLPAGSLALTQLEKAARSIGEAAG